MGVVSEARQRALCCWQIAAYTDAIELKRQIAPKEVSDLLANRAAAYFADEKPMDAFWDCKSALFVQPGHLKATLRLAKAQAAMAKYEGARDLLTASPHTTRPEFKSEISRMNCLVRESQSGDYDLKSMLKQVAATKTPRLDHADFNGGVREKWISDEKGNGLIALRDFAPGDLLFVCKAFMVVYTSECDSTNHDATRNECVSRIIGRISKNIDLVKEVCRLYAGPDWDRFTDVDQGEALAVNPGRVAAIVRVNEFGSVNAPLGVEGELQRFDKVRHGFCFGGRGVWKLASFMNHSCLPNTVSFFVGDIMFVRAIKTIRKGNELTTSYVASTTNYARRQEILRRRDVACQCELCVFDEKMLAERPFLEEQRDAFDSYFKVALPRLIDRNESRATIMQELRKSTDEFSSSLPYKDRYDQPLSEFYTTLASAYSVRLQFLKGAKTFEMALTAAVGNGTTTDEPFSYNALTRNAFFLCFSIAQNYLFCRDFVKAKEYLSKAQTAANIVWGSAD